MHGRGITRWGFMGAVALVCSCADNENTTAPDAAVEVDAPLAADAAPGEYSVCVTAVGVLQPLGLRLEYPGGSETLTITGDGMVAFAVSWRPAPLGPRLQQTKRQQRRAFLCLR